MPYRIEYRDSDGGVITHYSGKLTEAEFLACTEEKFANPEIFTRYRYSISDFSGVTEFSVGLNLIKENAMLSNQAMRANQSGVMAIVVNSVLLIGMGNLWRGNTLDTDDRVGVFRCLDEAQSWVHKQLQRHENRG
jgi:hypothetical protein